MYLTFNALCAICSATSSHARFQTDLEGCSNHCADRAQATSPDRLQSRTTAHLHLGIDKRLFALPCKPNMACAEVSQFFVPEGREYRVAGLAALSYTEDTRDDFAELGDPPVPEDSIYLTNMVVSKYFRRYVPS